MNIRPFIALGIIGAIVGLAIGYVAYKATGGLFDIYNWATREFGGRPLDALFWTIGGAAVGFALAYLRSLNSK
jgi:hypothetical protein